MSHLALVRSQCKVTDAEWKKTKQADLVEYVRMGMMPQSIFSDFIPCSAREMPEGQAFDLRLIKYADGNLQEIVVDSSGVVTLAGSDTWKTLIARYLGFCQAWWKRDQFVISERDVERIHELWRIKSDLWDSSVGSDEKCRISEEDIAPVLFKNQPGYCWHRMDFDPEDSDLGLWNDVADRMSNWPAFLAWLGSLFDPKSNREQFIWMCGEGATGKSTIIDVILECFGCASLVTTCEAVEEKWFVSELEGKRLAHIDEASAKFMRGHKVKSMTGNGKQRCEAKFKSPKTININTKFIFTSNDFPDVQARKEYTRRIILCEIDPIKDRTMTRDEAEIGYKKSLPALFHRAIRAYEAHRASGSFAIDSDQETIQEYAGSADDNADRLFRKFYRVDECGWVPSSDIYESMDKMGIRSYETRRLVREWQRLFGIKPKQKGEDRTRGYAGMRRLSW
jgi:hypothetical protein